MTNSSWMGDIPPPIPDSEAQRLAILRRYEDPDKEPVHEETFDRLASLAAQICEVPVSFINLIGTDKEFKKSCFGYNGETIPRGASMCQFTIMQDDVFEIKDTHKDHLFRFNPNVESPLRLRYYAGVPLRAPGGQNVGALCIIDHKPNSINEGQKKALKTLADEVISRFELNAAKKMLDKLNDEKDDLIKVISHDMRNPLMGIIGFAGHLKTEVDNTEHIDILEIIEDAGISMRGIVNALLDATYDNIENFSVLREKTNVATELYDVLMMQKPNALIKNQKFVLDIEDPLFFKVDSEKWKQIAGNLLSNAIKYTPPGGEIHVTLTLSEMGKKTMELIVADSGIGMPSEIRDNIFSGSGTIQRSGTEGELSTGLGMQIVKKYVDLHQGKINLESSPGKGTRFTINFPS